MELYFSHSYRDVRINTYFFTELAENGFRLFADQKSPVWCVAKLERYLFERSGFLSVIPRRIGEDQKVTYSPYIGYELSLARRSRVPRLLFIDDEVLNRYRTQFPPDAVPFMAASPARDRARHIKAIHDFKDRLEKLGQPQMRSYRDRQATVVAAGGKAIAEAAEGVIALLDQSSYEVTLYRGRQVLAAFEDVALFETLLSSELCVFLLDARVSYADVIMGMAHAHSIPSIRLQYDPKAEECRPALSGRLPWSQCTDLLRAFSEQFDSFRSGLVEAVSLAEESSATEAVRAIGTTKWEPAPEQLWDISEGSSLRNHVKPLHPFVLDQIDRVNRMLGSTLAARSGRGKELEVCMALYRGLAHLHLAYEFEPQSTVPGRQAVRTPADIVNSKAATCIDLSCLFGSLLTAAGLRPLAVVLDGKRYAHALAGYRAPHAPDWSGEPSLGDIRAALDLGDLVLFEATGAAESEQPVGAETAEERREGGRMLDFMTSRAAAERLIRSDVKLRFAVDLGPPA